MTTLDDEISTAFGLLGLLLVFVIGYFAALFPLAQDLLERPAPEVAADRRALISRLRTYWVLVGGVLLLTVGTGVVVTPLTRRVVQAIAFRGPFPTVQAGLLLIDVMLLALFAVTVWLWVRLGRRIRLLRARDRG
jgi:predicted metal-binding membrane protein